MKIRWITNTPTPYRNHRHRMLGASLAKAGIDYSVYYMAWTEPDRHWSFVPGQLGHRHRIFAGIHPWISGMHLHFNPGMLATLRSEQPEVVLIGGWSMPTLMLAPLVLRHSIRLLGVESHADSVRWSAGAAGRLRRAMVCDADGFVVPGDRSRTFIESIDPAARTKPFLTLPNLVDEAVWREGVDSMRGEADRVRTSLGVAPEQQLWVCPARLERFKGVHTLLPLLKDRRGVLLAIAGDGSLRGELQEQIDRDRLPARLLGQQREAQMQALYAAADLFVLPSLSDPNPLSAVEATAAALPLWLSTRCGNVDDVLAAGDNGWRYDPDDTAANATACEAILATSRAQLRAAGARSRARFAARFDSTACIEKLADQLVQLAEAAA